MRLRLSQRFNSQSSIDLLRVGRDLSCSWHCLFCSCSDFLCKNRFCSRYRWIPSTFSSSFETEFLGVQDRLHSTISSHLYTSSTQEWVSRVVVTIYSQPRKEFDHQLMICESRTLEQFNIQGYNLFHKSLLEAHCQSSLSLASVCAPIQYAFLVEIMTQKCLTQ